MKARNFLIYTGYVESGSWSALPLYHLKGFDSVEEALIDLGQAVLKAAQDEIANQWKPECCRKTVEANPEQKFCNCGKRVLFDPIDSDKLSDMIRDWHRGTMNEGGPSDIWEEISNRNWCQWGYHSKRSNFNNVIIVNENGEDILANAAFGHFFDSPNYAGFKSRENYMRSSILAPKKMKLFK